MTKSPIFFVSYVAFFAVTFYLISWLAKMPDAHFSNATGECVRVVNHDRDAFYTCDSLPSRYNHVWVE